MRSPRTWVLRRYPVVERHGAVWVWLGDAMRADSELIPAARGPEDPELMMRWDWLLIMPVIFYTEGTAQRCSFGPPPAEIEPLQDTYNLQAVTPMTARKTRYFFAAGMGRYGGSTEFVDALHQVVIAAFKQDKALITAQQQVLDRSPGRKMGPTVHDRAPNHLRLLIEKMLRSEQAA